MLLNFHFLHLLIGISIANWRYTEGCTTTYWADEFDGSSDLSSNWNYNVGGNGWGNQELQYYTNLATNSRIESNALIIEARKEVYNNSNNYTSARLVSKRGFTYGIFEMRAKLPQGNGTWPAFWLLPSKKGSVWPDDGEIDIMEHVGYDPGVMHGTIHTKIFNHKLATSKSGTKKVVDPFGTWHTYKLDWNASRIQIFVDDVKYFEYTNTSNSTYETWPFYGEFKIILNLAIGGSWGGLGGVDTSIFPQKYTIDYVRWNSTSGASLTYSSASASSFFTFLGTFYIILKFV